jgi:hypothetical protein
MIAALTLTHHMVEETETIHQQVGKLYLNGFTGGLYSDNAIYADTPTEDKTDKLQRLFPLAKIRRFVCSGITIIIL